MSRYPCRYFKKLRERIANEYGIEGFEFEPCEFENECTNICGHCNSEGERLYNLIKKLGCEIKKIDISSDNSSMGTSELNVEPLIFGQMVKYDFSEPFKTQIPDKGAIKGSVYAIDRHRVNIDGQGVVSLIGMRGCPLNCKYCINKIDTDTNTMSIAKLYNKLKKDSVYFVHTDGGICFGGQEPLLNIDFVCDFIEYVRNKGETWRVGVETCLNVTLKSKQLERLLSLIDYIVIDIKDINADIYRAYTGKSNMGMLRVLDLVLTYRDYLSSQGHNLDITVRVPFIEGYNTREDVEKSVEYLLSKGFKEEELDIFDYELNFLDDFDEKVPIKECENKPRHAFMGKIMGKPKEPIEPHIGDEIPDTFLSEDVEEPKVTMGFIVPDIPDFPDFNH